MPGKLNMGNVSTAAPGRWSRNRGGPRGRPAPDAALILKAIAGRDAGDGTSSEEPVLDYAKTLADTRLKGGRIGVPDSFFFDNVDGGSLGAIRAALFLLRDMKAQVDEVSLPHAAEASSAVTAIMLPER